MAQQPRESTVGPQTPGTKAAVDSFSKTLSKLDTPQRRGLQKLMNTLTLDLIPTFQGDQTKNDAEQQPIERQDTVDDSYQELSASDDTDMTDKDKPRKAVEHSAAFLIGKAVSDKIVQTVRQHPDGGRDIMDTKPASVSSQVSKLSISERKGKIEISAHLKITMFGDTRPDENSEPTNRSGHSVSNN